MKFLAIASALLPLFLSQTDAAPVTNELEARSTPGSKHVIIQMFQWSYARSVLASHAWTAVIDTEALVSGPSAPTSLGLLGMASFKVCTPPVSAVASISHRHSLPSHGTSLRWSVVDGLPTGLVPVDFQAWLPSRPSKVRRPSRIHWV